MAVAVKNTPETAPQRRRNALAVGSLAGTLYVVGSLAVILYLAYLMPGAAGTFVGNALFLLLILGVAAGLVVLGRWLLGEGLHIRAQPPHGLRAGIFFGVVGVLAIGLVVRTTGGILEHYLAAGQSLLGNVILGVVAGVLLLAGSVAFFRAGFDNWLVKVEDQGWFNASAYKRSQGQRVRRGTILGILILAACGLYTLINHGSLRTAASPHLEATLPFSGGQTLRLLPNIEFTVPMLLAAASLWLAYRIVNFPPFADFLIATEAELNKVSWTTRKRLIQDTIVVLTTMLLLTVFLFAVDVAWTWVLSRPWIQVLQTPSDTKKQSATNDW